MTEDLNTPMLHMRLPSRGSKILRRVTKMETKTFTKKELKEILRKHELWLQDSNQQDAKRANMCSADLRGADLCFADLCSADLRGTDLRGAGLCFANLCSADLRGANLCSANLCGADLRGTDLRGADLRDAENIPFIPYACPDSGAFIGYKKAQRKIVELEILSDAKRVSATGRKCRCDKAKVLSIQNIDGTQSILTSVASDRDSTFIYKIGEIVTVDDFDENRWNECSTGIHFFINRQEAVEY